MGKVIRRKVDIEERRTIYANDNVITFISKT